MPSCRPFIRLRLFGDALQVASALPAAYAMMLATDYCGQRRLDVYMQSSTAAANSPSIHTYKHIFAGLVLALQHAVAVTR